ncbi:hypothetical protein ACFLSF_04600, partial [Candidatus Bipolaricaulota bacterium]
TVTDVHGASAADQLLITVTNCNLPPYVDAGDDETMVEGAMKVLTCSAGDPDGDAVSYSWSAGSGSFVDSHVLHPTYTAPMLDSEETRCVPVTLTVTDVHGASAADQLLITVTNQPECRVISCSSYCRLVAEEGQTTSLSGKAWDPDGDVLHVSWWVSEGLIGDSHALTTTYTAPMLPPGEPCRVVDVELQVIDSCGGKAVDRQQILVVSAPTLSPIVDAGPEVLCSATRAVMLEARRAHDAEGGDVRVLWSISRGCGFLTGDSTLTPTLVFCPESRDGDEILVTLSAVDKNGLRATDAILVRLAEVGDE